MDTAHNIDQKSKITDLHRWVKRLYIYNENKIPLVWAFLGGFQPQTLNPESLNLGHI